MFLPTSSLYHAVSSLSTVVGTDYLGNYAASRNDVKSSVKCGLSTEQPYDCFSDGKGDGAFMRNGECVVQTRRGANGLRVSNEANVLLMT